MALYQGRALRTEPSAKRHHRRWRVKPLLHVLAGLAAIVVLSHLPWDGWRKRWAVVSPVRVEGAEYLDAQRIAAIAGVREGADLFDLDLDAARQALLMNARIARAEVHRYGLRGVRIRVAERRPVLLVRHGEAWEMDSTGVLLAPFVEGSVADVPLLTGPDFASFPEGATLRTVQAQRGLQWVLALSARELQLGGRVSEIDVSDSRTTELLMMSGTRVLLAAWPPDTRRLSALRVVLADLDRKGIAAQEVDLRYQDQVIVRPAGPAHAEAAGARAG